ncbi:ABC transporter substrate-binding protein [soil metagenome]
MGSTRNWALLGVATVALGAITAGVILLNADRGADTALGPPPTPVEVPTVATPRPRPTPPPPPPTPRPRPTATPTPTATTAVPQQVRILQDLSFGDDEPGLEASLDVFRAANPDITVLTESVTDIRSAIQLGAAGGTLPDLVISANAAGVREDITSGLTRPMALDRGELEALLVPGALHLMTVDGQLHGLPLRVNVKSVVYYNRPIFAERGYAVPGTWEEMLQLTSDIAADGTVAPWCIGIESASATGWVATDWVEDVVLRTVGTEGYDRWVAGELPFDSPQVRGAIEQAMVPIWTDEAAVHGGRAAIATTSFQDAGLGVLGGADAQCVLHRQAPFIELFIQDADPTAAAGVDFDAFLLPAIDPAAGTPVVGSQDTLVQYRDGEAVDAVVAWLATPEAARHWAGVGNFVSPHLSLHGGDYADERDARSAALLAQATVFRLDASDLMPGSVGGTDGPGTFWTEMTRWISGEVELATALQAIDQRFSEALGR